MRERERERGVADNGDSNIDRDCAEMIAFLEINFLFVRKMLLSRFDWPICIINQAEKNGWPGTKATTDTSHAMV